MTRNTVIVFILSIAVLASCDNSSNPLKSSKKYKYIEVIEKEKVFGGTEIINEEAEIIEASNDTLAYLEAYEKFCIALKVDKDVTAKLGSSTTKPIEFKLYDDVEKDISAIHFASKEKKKSEIETSIFSLDNSLSSLNNENPNVEGTKTDTAKIKELKKNFRIEKDEFSNTNRTSYEPKSSPQYANRNGIYCYFYTENDIPSRLRFRVQYHDDDWLFFSKIQFSIDGKAFDYIPSDTETDSGNGGYIWEWSDEGLTGVDKDLIYALSDAKSAKMKFIGTQYYDIKTISKEQIKAIKQTLELYHAMGGQF